jgi:hypothetical protein
MARKQFNVGLGAAALVLLVSGGIGLADGPVTVGPAGPCCGTDGACAAEGCCKTCVPTPTNKKVTLRHYGETCEDFCVCKPTFLGGLFNLREGLQKDHDRYIGRGPGDQPCGECGGCGCGGNCGSPYVKKFLLIHIREHNEGEMKCQIPGQRPAVGIVTAAPDQYPGPRTPRLDPSNGIPSGPSGTPGTGFPQASPNQDPGPRTPRLDPGR